MAQHQVCGLGGLPSTPFSCSGSPGPMSNRTVSEYGRSSEVRRLLFWQSRSSNQRAGPLTGSFMRSSDGENFIILPLYIYHVLGHQSIPIPVRKPHPVQNAQLVLTSFFKLKELAHLVKSWTYRRVLSIYVKGIDSTGFSKQFKGSLIC